VYQLKNHIAYFLLLLFVRVMIPEQGLLQFHSHEHTEEMPVKKNTGIKLETKHQHCHIDQLFNASFAPTQTVVIKAILIPFSDTYSANHSYIWKFTFPNNTDLRGPPVV